MGFLIRLPRAASYLDENLISTHLWDRLSNAILKALFTSLTQFPIPLDDDDLEIAAYHLYKFMVRLHPRGMRPSRQPLGRETRSDGKIISDGRFRENNPSGKKLAAHASNQFAKHRIKPQDYLEALARVF